ncbi:MAG: sugar phosphate isomerase/epimerase [Kiritimatiellae bacterium]|nr:sugar phosphate isomerase/epimerase [Kiritimatiellia bacterium]
MNIGCCSWSFQKPLAEVAGEMKKLDVHYLHLATMPFLAGDARHGGNAAADDRALVERLLAAGEWHIAGAMLSFPYEDYSTIERIRYTGGIVPDEHWEEYKGLIRGAVKLGAEWKAPFMMLHAGFLDESDPVAKQKYLDRIRFLVDVAGESGLGVALETGQETANELLRFLNEVPEVFVNFDPANMILYGKGNPVEAVKLLGSRIRGVHIKDAKVSANPGVEWGCEVPWGDGEVNTDAFLAALKATGFNDTVAVEREAGNDRAGDIALAVSRLRAAL